MPAVAAHPINIVTSFASGGAFASRRAARSRVLSRRRRRAAAISISPRSKSLTAQLRFERASANASFDPERCDKRDESLRSRGRRIEKERKREEANVHNGVNYFARVPNNFPNRNSDIIFVDALKYIVLRLLRCSV